MKKVFEFLIKNFFYCFVFLCLSGCILVTNNTEEPRNDFGATVVHDFQKDNKADVLMLFYMDGDNNLAQPIWQDLNEVEYGLYCAEKGNDNKSKVDVFVLWDGNKYGDTRLYKLGADSRVSMEGIPGFEGIHTGLSEKTLDLTFTAPWIYNETNGKYEVSMSNPKTLEKFLRWINEHYIIDNNTQLILQFADHGGGPRSLSLSDNNLGNSRAMCQDINPVGENQSPFLYTKDIPAAIKASGILNGEKKKIDLVIQDVCNGASVEEAYEYKDVADYMLLSPNEMPGYGLNYVDLMGHFKEGDCIFNGHLNVEKFLDKAVYDFIDVYKQPEGFWTQLEENIKENNEKLPIRQQLPDSTFTPLYISMCYTKAPTITALKLSHIQQVQADIKNLVELLDKNDNTFIDKNSVISNKNYLTSLMNLVFTKMGYYKTTFATLYDIREFSDKVLEFNDRNSNYSFEIKEAVEKLQNSLDRVILYSWRDGVGGALYNKSSYKNLEGIAPFNNGSYGLVISGLSFKYNYNNEPVNLKFPGVEENMGVFYSSELLFGKDTQCWEKFMKDIIASNSRFSWF